MTEDWPTRESRTSAAARIMARLELPNPDTDINGAQAKARQRRQIEVNDKALARDYRDMASKLGYGVGDEHNEP